MDKSFEKSLNETATLGLQHLRMLLIEAFVATEKQEGRINEKQYTTFREVADKHWSKFDKKLDKHTKNIRRV